MIEWRCQLNATDEIDNSTEKNPKYFLQANLHQSDWVVFFSAGHLPHISCCDHVECFINKNKSKLPQINWFWRCDKISSRNFFLFVNCVFRQMAPTDSRYILYVW